MLRVLFFETVECDYSLSLRKLRTVPSMTTHRILKRFSIFVLLVTSPNGAEAKKKKKKKHVSATDWEARFPVPPKPETSPVRLAQYSLDLARWHLVRRRSLTDTPLPFSCLQMCDACQFSAIKVKQLYEQGSI